MDFGQLEQNGGDTAIPGNTKSTNFVFLPCWGGVTSVSLPPLRDNYREAPCCISTLPLEIEGLTIFRDYNATNRFYYMPRSPRLTIEGSAIRCSSC